VSQQAQRSPSDRPALQRSPIRATTLRVIGWSELVDLPDWGISRLRAKIDTGARTSALHVENLVDLGGARVGFDVRLHRKRQDRRMHVVAKVTRRGRVRSSSGHYENRIFVRTRFRIGPILRPIEISLVDRQGMLFRMLIGRTALAGSFVIDPSRRRLLSKKKRKKR
jgi:hypothetical protein